ncbi:hypothetical protein D9619_000011 [Psilocybe cf. subviscida]|uniref:Uncharacterized protein n=1 Tax=Psilocybe cf. subviscida TaxID=2480587 RepID=A0A8H5BEM5_9AGAR|nr:hypothetical protein D9619_000011 [Psilocybe cf. subviscida]
MDYSRCLGSTGASVSSSSLSPAPSISPSSLFRRSRTEHMSFIPSLFGPIFTLVFKFLRRGDTATDLTGVSYESNKDVESASVLHLGSLRMGTLPATLGHGGSTPANHQPLIRSPRFRLAPGRVEVRVVRVVAQAAAARSMLAHTGEELAGRRPRHTSHVNLARGHEAQVASDCCARLRPTPPNASPSLTSPPHLSGCLPRNWLRLR